MYTHWLILKFPQFLLYQTDWRAEILRANSDCIQGRKARPRGWGGGQQKRVLRKKKHKKFFKHVQALGEALGKIWVLCQKTVGGSNFSLTVLTIDFPVIIASHSNSARTQWNIRFWLELSSRAIQNLWFCKTLLSYNLASKDMKKYEEELYLRDDAKKKAMLEDSWNLSDIN